MQDEKSLVKAGVGSDQGDNGEVSREKHNGHIRDTEEVEVFEADEVVDRLRGVVIMSSSRRRNRVLGSDLLQLATSLRLGPHTGLRRVIGLFDMRVLDDNQEGELGGMGDDGDEQDVVARSHHGDTIVTSVPDRVHGMRSQLKDAVESKFLLNEVEEVTPVPSIVLDNTMSIQLDPQVEANQCDANSPTGEANEETLTVRLVSADDGEQAVRDEVAHENQVDDAAEGEPSVVFDGSLFKLVILRDLGLEFLLEQVVEPWARVLASRGVLEQLPPLGPSHQELVLGLDSQKVTNADIVSQSPEHEDGGKERPLDAPG